MARCMSRSGGGRRSGRDSRHSIPSDGVPALDSTVACVWVLYLGYGASMTETQAFSFQELERTSDGFLVTLSWLYRVP